MPVLTAARAEASLKCLENRWKLLLDEHNAEFTDQLAQCNGRHLPKSLAGLSEQIDDVVRTATAAGASSPRDAATLIRMGMTAQGVDLDDTEDTGIAAIVAGLAYLERWVPSLMAASISVGEVCEISRHALALTFLA